MENGADPATLAIGDWNFTAANEGAWGNNLRVRIDHNTRPLKPGEAADSLFNLAVKDRVTGETERFLNLSFEVANARFAARVLEQESHLIRVAATGAARPTANAPLPTPSTDPFDAAMSTPFVANSGKDGDDITEGQIINPALEQPQQGIWALEQADLFNLMCIPPFSRDADVTKNTWDAAAIYCKRRRAVLIVDSPPLGMHPTM